MPRAVVIPAAVVVDSSGTVASVSPGAILIDWTGTIAVGVSPTVVVGSVEMESILSFGFEEVCTIGVL